ENGGERVGSCRAKGRAVPAEGGPGRGRAETWRPCGLQGGTWADHGRQDTRAQGGILAKKDGEGQLRRVREDDGRSTGRLKSLGFFLVQTSVEWVNVYPWLQTSIQPNRPVVRYQPGVWCRG